MAKKKTKLQGKTVKVGDRKGRVELEQGIKLCVRFGDELEIVSRGDAMLFDESKQLCMASLERIRRKLCAYDAYPDEGKTPAKCDCKILPGADTKARMGLKSGEACGCVDLRVVIALLGEMSDRQFRTLCSKVGNPWG